MKRLVYSTKNITADREFLFTLDDIVALLSGIQELQGSDIEVMDLGNGYWEFAIDENVYSCRSTAK